MKALLQHNFWLLIILLFFSNFIYAQDIIVKTDKIEIKSKVLEMTETTIKYKKWEMQDGPIYNINKPDVFMILYANGQREIIKQQLIGVEKIETTGVNTTSSNVPKIDLANSINQSTKKIDTAVDYKHVKVNYKPVGIYAGLQEPFSLGLLKEWRLIKNIINLGTDIRWDFIDGAESGAVTAYLSLYAPLNRLTGNYRKQSSGLFFFGHFGYQVYSSSVYYGGNRISNSAGDITWRMGADYNFGPDWGIRLFTQKFESAYAGIVFTL